MTPDREDGPLIVWTKEELLAFYHFLYGYEPNNPVELSAKVRLDRSTYATLSLIIQDIDMETKPKEHIWLNAIEWSPELLFAWYNVWKNLIVRHSKPPKVLKPLYQQNIYYLEVFFNAHFKELPLLVNHEIPEVKKTVQWRLGVGK